MAATTIILPGAARRKFENLVLDFMRRATIMIVVSVLSANAMHFFVVVLATKPDW